MSTSTRYLDVKSSSNELDPDWQKTLKKAIARRRSNEKQGNQQNGQFIKAAEELSNGRKSSAFLRYTYIRHAELYENKLAQSDEYNKLVQQSLSIVEAEFDSAQQRKIVPTMASLIDVILSRYKEDKNTGMYHVKFEEGDWVEVLDDDMQWRLQRIKEIKMTDIDGDGDAGDEEWELLYDVGSQKNLSSDEIRCPEAGLKALFGVRPWVWQQYALLKLEERLRFQKDHAEDFVNFPIKDYIEDLWKQWLDNPDNSDFKELFNHNLIGESGRRSLVKHIMTPFNFMVLLAEGKDGMDVTHPDVVGQFGAFTYLSFLGDGFVLPTIILSLQILIPALIIVGNLYRFLWVYGKFDNREISISRFSVMAEEPEWFFQKALCVHSPVLATATLQNSSLMALVIMCLYLCQVTPETLMNFYLQVGNAGNNVFHKMKSLRMRIRDAKNDRIGQNIGYSLDLVMNTCYVCILYMLNIFNVIQTDDTFEMLLNCLALIFVSEIDEEFSQSPWWDEGHRWLKASAVELALQYYVNKPALRNANLFALKFNMNLEVLHEICNNDINLFKNRKVAASDCRNMNLMTEEERVRFMSSELALLTKNKGAIAQYCKEQQYFGYYEYKYIMTPYYSFKRLFNPDAKLTGGVFSRYENYRTWSRWNDILFIGVLPDFEAIIKMNDKSLKMSIYEGVPVNKSSESKEFDEDEWNFDPTFRSSYTYFWTVTVLDTLLFRELSKKIASSIAKGRIFDVFFWIYDFFFEWISFIVHIIFPMYCLWGIIIWGFCWNSIKDQPESEYEPGF